MDINTIGNKASDLLVLKNVLHLKVPQFYIIDNQQEISGEFFDEFYQGIDTTKVYSIRSSPVISMPGMLETILNFCTKETDKKYYKKHLQQLTKLGVDIDSYTKLTFKERLRFLISVIRDSINNNKADIYCKMKGVEKVTPGVVVQEMVFGDKDQESCSGVLFSRDNKGEFGLFGQYLRMRQGIDLVDNSITGIDINKGYFTKKFGPDRLISLREILYKCEEYYKTAVEIEFTFESNVLYILQCRKLNFDDYTQFKIDKDLVTKGILTEDYLSKYDNLSFEINYEDKNIFAKCDIANPGIIEGKVMFEDSLNTENSDDSILVIDKIQNEDIAKLQFVKGVITRIGSFTSHPANICRNLKIPYLINKKLVINKVDKTIKYKKNSISEKQSIILDCYKGNILTHK